MMTSSVDINRRVCGGLVQLVAYGAPDTYLFANASDATPYNTRDSMASRWFVAHEDGFASQGDVVGSSSGEREPDMSTVDYNTWQSGSILAHAPESMAPAKGSLQPFSVREERLANPPNTTMTD